MVSSTSSNNRAILERAESDGTVCSWGFSTQALGYRSIPINERDWK